MFRISRSLISLLLFAFIDLMSMGLVYPMFSSMIFSPDCSLLPPDTSESTRGLWLGILLATMPITQFFFSPIIGSLSDQKGRRPMLLFCCSIGIFGYLLANIGVHFMNILILTLSRVLLGVMGSGLAIVMAAVSDISTEKNKSSNYSLINAAFGLGFAVGPYLGGKLSSLNPLALNFALPFYLAGVLVLSNSLIAYFSFKETLQELKTTSFNWFEGIKNIRHCFAHKSLRSIFLASFFVFAGWSFYYEFIPATWIKTKGFDVAKVGFLYGISAFMYAFANVFLAPFITKFISPKKTLIMALFLESLAISALLLPHNDLYLIIFLAIQNLSMALIYPTLATNVSDSAEKDSQGHIMGIFSSIDAFAFAVSPLLSGAFLSLSYYSPLYVGAVCMFLAGSVLLRNFIPKHKVQKSYD